MDQVAGETARQTRQTQTSSLGEVGTSGEGTHLSGLLEELLLHSWGGQEH